MTLCAGSYVTTRVCPGCPLHNSGDAVQWEPASRGHAVIQHCKLPYMRITINGFCILFWSLLKWVFYITPSVTCLGCFKRKLEYRYKWTYI